MRYFRGILKKVGRGSESTLAQYESLPQQTLSDDIVLLGSLPHHLVLDEGKLFVAHAGLPQNFRNRHYHKVRNFALYGQRGPDITEDGFRVALTEPRATQVTHGVVHGHTLVAAPRSLNRVVCIDSGCVFGAK